MRTYFLSFFVLITLSRDLFAQTTAGFEEIGVTASGFYNGSDNTGGFSSGGLRFRNSYDTQFSFWTGFAVSNLGDTSTAGFANQYSTYAGAAAAGQKFALGYASPGPSWLVNENPAQARRLVSLKLTNSTYAALSMKNGDAFSKKFGGTSGNDPDFFLLTIRSFRNGLVTDSARIYLADFRSPDNSQDYILKNWRTETLNFTQAFDSVGFYLSSSDNGQFGMNTPAYFCLDEVVTEAVTQTQSVHRNAELRLYPNPVRSALTLSFTGKARAYHLLDSRGRELEAGILVPGLTRLDVNHLAPGPYLIRLDSGECQSFVRQ